MIARVMIGLGMVALLVAGQPAFAGQHGAAAEETEVQTQDQSAQSEQPTAQSGSEIPEAEAAETAGTSEPKPSAGSGE